MKLSDEQALKYIYPGKGHITSNGIHVEGNLIINDLSPLIDTKIDNNIKTQFYSVSQNFSLETSELTSLEGCPLTVGNNCAIVINHEAHITSFKGCPQFAMVFKYLDRYNKYESLEGICRKALTFRMFMDGLTSYHNVHKYIDSFKLFEMTEHVKDSILGFVLVKEPGSLIRKYDDSPLDRALEIVDKYTNEYHDVLECQEELIDNGLKQYAKL